MADSEVNALALDLSSFSSVTFLHLPILSEIFDNLIETDELGDAEAGQETLNIQVGNDKFDLKVEEPHNNLDVFDKGLEHPIDEFIAVERDNKIDPEKDNVVSVENLHEIEVLNDIPNSSKPKK